MRKFFLIIMVTLCSLGSSLVAQQPFGYLFEKDQIRDTIRFTNESNLIVIPIKINGKGPYKFILDTGSESGMIFDQSIIDEAYIAGNRVVPIYSGNGELVTELLVARTLDIVFGGIRGKSQSMLVFQEYNLDIRNALGVDAMGILGSEIFNRFIVEVNYEEELLILHDPRSFKKPRGYKKIPIELKDSRPFAAIEIKQKGQRKARVNLLVDSGASSPLFLDAENNENITVPEDNIRHTVGNGLTGTIDGKVGRVQKLKIGPFKFSNVVTSFPINWEIEKKLKDKENDLIRYGTIGSDALSRFHVIYDYLNEVIYLKPNKKYRNKFHFNTIGFRIVALGEDYNEFFVSELIENSDASKIGINVGDQIIAINGRPVSSFKFSEINSILRAEPATKTILILRRNGVLIKKVIKHKKLI